MGDEHGIQARFDRSFEVMFDLDDNRYIGTEKYPRCSWK